MTSLAVSPGFPGAQLEAALGSLEARGREPVLAAVRRFPAEPARLVPFPEELHPRLAEALRARGIEQLYSHQREAWDAVQEGRSVTVVTPTASGKTLCFNLPVVDRILRDPDARALYLFPTKALAQDQLAALDALVAATGTDVAAFTYDGDTPADARKSIRARAHVVVTNPDMLHKGILPHHTKWVKLLENLRYVVIDELHGLRGVYGSHVANVLRRLWRLCRFYGAQPQIVCCSATIGNPRDLAESLTGRAMRLVEKSGAPRGQRTFAIYNPPVVNRALGIRRSALRCARDVALAFLKRRLQTIVFAPSRLTTEVLLAHLQSALAGPPGAEDTVRGYRGGYLPLRRREIERGLREGRVMGVVSTNALELGVDIGGLDAAVLLGYPGSVASTWQQAGRAGRRASPSVAVMVASSNPLDQFVAAHPQYLFDAPVEQGRINADNLQILLSHVKCAAFELPFTEDEAFGAEDLGELLRFLEEQRLLHRSAGRWHWTSESYPADAVSLRSVSSDNFVVQDVTRDPCVIAEVDYDSAPSMLHEKAVYILEGKTYFVEKYDHQQRRAEVRQAEVDYYTQAVTQARVRVIDTFETSDLAAHGPEAPSDVRLQGVSPRRTPLAAPAAQGEVHVTSQVVGFKKIRFETGENVGAGELRMPEQEMHTTSYWLTLPRALMAALPYGNEERRDGVVGLSYVLGQLAALFLMCDRRDLGVAVGEGEEALPAMGRKAPPPGAAAALATLSAAETYEPRIFVYDNYPSGMGMSQPLFRLHDRLLAQARALIAACPCDHGCPSCTGPVGETGHLAKEVALSILDAIAHGGAAFTTETRRHGGRTEE
jgi:DEAD/DEAH box helicase domain-containing protein